MSVELLAPAGDFETALAAFAAGADAVYCGLPAFSARAYATNFSPDGLKRLMRLARARGRKVYVTFNTLVDEADVADAVRQLSVLDGIRPSALIVQDLGVARLCRTYFPDLELHASTQLVAHNLAGVLALRDLGFTRAVLARELGAEEIAAIARRCGGMELECFIHGALCYSISGLCLFGALEKGRSGNRGRCPYCCRQSYEVAEPSGKALPFSMKDLRLGADVRKLVEAGVASLKIEGRMKSALYVAAVTKYYRQILGDAAPETGPRVTEADLETVFSRRTTTLYFNDPRATDVIDPTSLGHLGTPVGTVKRITKDREGQAWLRFHTNRALEKHDGLQFAAKDGGKPAGFGIALMRPAIARTPVCEVPAGSDVEVLLPPGFGPEPAPGETVYCAMSNAVKRMFPVPGYRPGDCPGTVPVDLAVKLEADAISATATADGTSVTATVKGAFAPAQAPEKTVGGVAKAFSRLGETDYAPGSLTVDDPGRLFAPMSSLNDLRRDLVAALDAARARAGQARLEKALADDACGPLAAVAPARRLKVRAGQQLPQGPWDEIVVAVNAGTGADEVPCAAARLALPVYTPEPAFNRLRIAVKRFLRAGFARWEASDLATLRMLRELGVADITADWTAYAFNASALKTWTGLGVARFVASPENDRANLQFLAESGYAVEFLAQQSTPLFVSLTPPAATPAASSGLAVFRRDGLWVTTKRLPRTFAAPEGAPLRFDLSWDPA